MPAGFLVVKAAQAISRELTQPLTAALTVDAVLGRASTPLPVVPNYNNFTGSNLSQWLSAQAAKNAGTRNSVMLPYGDSTVAGVGAGTGANGVVNGKVGSWPSILAGLLSGGSATSVFGDNYISSIAGETVYIFDPTVTGTWVANTNGKTLGYYLNTTVVNTNTLVWAPATQCDTLVIGWGTHATNGVMVVKDESNNTLATLNQNAADSMRENIVTLPGGLGVHTFTVTLSSGSNVNLGYLRVYNSAVKETTVLTSGCAGLNSTQLISTTLAYSPINSMKFIAPDLTLIEGGVVNDWLQAIPLATSLSNLQAQITAAKLSGSAIMVSPPVGQPGIAYATQAQYVAQMKSLAYSNNIPFIDVWNGVFGGTYQASLMFDTKHCNTAGYTAIANFIVPALAAGFKAA
ncbi:GDSL-type esterase/lipase family protein [Bradyrhizobium sp. LTSP849]|uniref:SGNH/GDSL hydrolase family protein n=1 Tax=Bradyrhizobium sp. LTSP849 TaxID=1615890 RepID=UPI0026A3E20D